MCSDVSIDSILDDQYVLARFCNIGFLDSNIMPEFERKALVAKLIRDKKRESEGKLKK